MGLCETSIFSIFSFIKDNDLKFCTHSHSSCVFGMVRFKGSNGKVCKMMMLHFRTLLINELNLKFLKIFLEREGGGGLDQGSIQ